MNTCETENKGRLHLTAQYLLFLPCDRQLPLPLRLCLWSWLLCHPGGLPGGRGEDAVYELAPRPVPQPLRLYAEDGDPGGPYSLLQGVSSPPATSTLS